MHFDHGTTTLGFMYKNGVVLAVDSRATGGQYIGMIIQVFFSSPKFNFYSRFSNC